MVPRPGERNLIAPPAPRPAGAARGARAVGPAKPKMGKSREGAGNMPGRTRRSWLCHKFAASVTWAGDQTASAGPGTGEMFTRRRLPVRLGEVRATLAPHEGGGLWPCACGQVSHRDGETAVVNRFLLSHR